jgi:hypothetical protein
MVGQEEMTTSTTQQLPQQLEQEEEQKSCTGWDGGGWGGVGTKEKRETKSRQRQKREGAVEHLRAYPNDRPIEGLDAPAVQWQAY